MVYTDTQTRGVSHGCTFLDSPGQSGYPWCTRILRQRGSVMSVHPRIVRDILGIHGVHGYSDTGGQS